ncbi:hypothetical protein PR202_gb27818 [Eleusine coracana subsp. coracana]|uniref:Protein FAR1-RELATED SEQUENCE n=1 Tax=Eleusine coracana subsp. coracana TaxID=191504 RepID=A0AAV5FV88_ELECO|nr:hypothetical protein PR202_gb27818 [Eleusine coracana subsp. coracana]
MEYSSSEDDELVEDYIDVEDDTGAENIDQVAGVLASQIHRVDPSEGSMPPVGDQLMMAADMVGKSDEPYVGMEFESDAAARALYNAYAVRHGFGIRVARSRSERRKGVEVLVMKRFVCLKEGHHKKKPDEPSNKKKRKRLSIRDGCPAMMEVVHRGPDKWVRQQVGAGAHSCVIVSADRAREVQLRRLSGKFQEHETQLQEVRKNVFGDADAQGLFSYFKRMQWRILSRCKKRLSDVCTRFPGFHDELKRCINGCDTVPIFDMLWDSILDKYSLRDDTWLQSLYEMRHKWVPAYLTNSFFAELSLAHRVDTVGRFYRNNFSGRVSLNTFITRFDQYIDNLYASEAQKDLTSFPTEQLLKTNIILEKQAASIYTKAAFETFQVELIEAMQHFAVKVEDGPYMKYYVERHSDPLTRHTVFYNIAEKKAWCECCRFSFSAILCRHVLGVFILDGVIILPDSCITKRWTKKAKTGPELIGLNLGNDNSSIDSVSSRYNDLVRDAMKCAEKGSVSSGGGALRFAARAVPPVAPAAAATEEDKEKGRGEGLSPAEAERLSEFLRADLPHLFDDVGIDRTAYDDRVRFRDPITRHDTIDGYLFNIRLLKLLFRPDFYLHSVKQTGPYELTTRWTMVMKFMLLPWKPELVFTGVSIMGVNPQNLKFNSHVDLWDSIQNNEYFSFEGLSDVFKQLRIYKTPEIETPKYIILKKTANYEIVLPLNKDLDSLPAPNTEAVTLRKIDGGIAAVKKFSGRPKEEVVLQKEKDLRSQVLEDGLKPQQGCLLARYNDPRTQSFLMGKSCRWADVPM